VNLYEKSEMTAQSFWIFKKDLTLFILDETSTNYYVDFFGIQGSIKKPVNVKRVFVYCNGEKITISLSERFEYNLFSSMNLIEVYHHNDWDFPKEKRDMFSNFKITNVEFGEVSDVALETAVEKIAGNLKGVEIKTKADKTYLVKDGSAIELNGEEFISLVDAYVKGKTVSGLSRNSEMFTLIKNLGIIKKVTLESKGGDLSSIFG